MECDRAQEILWLLDDGTEDDPVVAEARRHQEGCFRCQEFFERDRDLAGRLGELPQECAPWHLHDRIRATLEAERQARLSPMDELPRGVRERPVRRAGAVALSSAAGLIIGLLGGWLVSEGMGTEDGDLAIRALPGTGVPLVMSGSPIEGFVQGAVEEERLLTSDREEAAAFLAERLGMDFRPPRYEGFQLIGVEICVWEDKRGVVVLYSRKGQMLYHYAIDGEEPATFRPRLSSSSPEGWMGSTRPSVAVWGDQRMQEALVGDLDPGSILSLVGERS